MPMEKTFNPAGAEARIAEAWERANAFAAGRNAKPGADSFSIVIPPPNVTGSLHMGHAFNNTLQDILTRWHRMRGFDTLWQPGTDHAGIATQMVVERELARDGKRRSDFTRPEFTALVWDQKRKSRGNIRRQLERLGASCDWSREAFTMSGAPGAPKGEEGNFHDAVIRVFVELYRKGHIYRGKRLVNWDPQFETAISDLEVESTEVDGHMWHFKYPLAGGATYEYIEKDADGNVTLRETRDYISIATTRPETMLGDGAVAVHPDDERYKPIVGLLCEIPVGPKEHRRLIPIITDEYPDPAFGSGAVKITGAHDFNDYGVAKRGGIPCYRLMDTRARMRTDGLPYAEAAAVAQAVARGKQVLSELEVDALNLVPDHLRGLDRYEARKRVVAEIEAEGLAVTTRADDPRLGKAALKPGAEGADAPVPLVEAKKIMQPFGDRSKVVIEPMLTDQWFVDAEKIVQPAIDAVREGRTKILPEQHEKVYFHWLENIEPWCISRQLWWGHQIPVWYGLDLWVTDFTDDEGDGALDEVELARLLADGGLVHTGEKFHCAADFAGVVDAFHDDLAGLPAPLHAARVVEVADRQAAIDMFAAALADYAVNQDPTHLVYPVWRDPDVLDTWFSSGLWPLGTLGWPEDTPELRRYFPTDVLVTGFDIIFFWVARMMMMQLAVVDQVPFHTVYVHALVRDEKGKKMSKSLGNVLDPLDLIDEFGADAVRFTLTAMAAMGRDLKLSKDRIAGYRNFGTKLWNATRFAEMNGVWEGHATRAAHPAVQATVNRWIIGETGRVREEVDAALTAFRFNDAANALYAFVWGKVCDWYVEFAKPLLADPATADETRATMGWVLDQCFTLLHPIMPFVTEDLWALTGARAKMLVHGDWPGYGTELVDPDAEREMRWVIALIEEVRSARAQMGVPAGLHLPIVLTALDDRGREAWARNEPLIKRLARLGDLTEGAAPKGAVTIAVEGGAFALPLAGVIDVAAEKARLEKTLAKLEKDLGGLKGRLSNPKFVDSAPADVVEETREQLDRAETDAAKLRTALARLAEAG
ncbi:valine--tRNA ligase [Ruixingdingia sedimenti]|uniref:Valine--tRNA ligase n=1 Tax=Ruixingdingia sedimenti TaxID=3073604 RepID=A0ABU1FCF4_9RHOB|nr:valine--tRNA ligase [Xinfangfangia sp. LG-4]MDR5654532.1 valine--tRNA ligase [Xinfangfangia sp. LG-4]